MRIIKSVLIVLFLGLLSCKSTKYNDLDDGIYADMQTERGDILLKLEYELVPVTVANFISLAEGTNDYVDESFKDKPYYDGLTFHRIEKDFMIQGGDPRANGTGDPGYKFEDELPTDENGNIILRHDGPGILSMANSGPDSNGSQFFITHKETKWLDGRHTVFGHVVYGQEVVDSIQKDDIINKVDILRVGREAKDFDAVKIFNDYFEEIEERQRLAEEKKEEKKKELLAFIEQHKEQAVELPSGFKDYFNKERAGRKTCHRVESRCLLCRILRKRRLV